MGSPDQMGTMAMANTPIAAPAATIRGKIAPMARLLPNARFDHPVPIAVTANDVSP